MSFIKKAVSTAIILQSFTGMVTSAATIQPKALIYRGPASCDGCPETVGTVLKDKFNFRVVYAGPNETTNITPETLSDATVYVQPGGGDLDPGWQDMKKYNKTIQDYVSNGGRYLGFCLGAYMAGYTPGFGLLPPGADSDEEISQDNSQVTDTDDTVIEVDWTFATGPKAGKTEKKRWIYFQDGATLTYPNASTLRHVTILGRYSQNQDIAATVSPYGRGWVGVTGPHPEADQSWYDDEDFTNPDGIKTDIVVDFITATLQGGKHGHR